MLARCIQRVASRTPSRLAPISGLHGRFFSAEASKTKSDPAEVLEKYIDELEPESIDKVFDYDNMGFVHTIGDGIAQVKALNAAKIGELIDFESGETGMVLGIEKNDFISIVVLGNDANIKQGETVYTTSTDVGLNAGPHLLGHVINGLEIGRAVQQECRDRSRMPSSA
eukprot:TRINITY_DN678_c0_g1_i13.p1 TRINITY_DN678_c0_g1~~TRINITY_DN678_c0_g1_i13.p1  ORF type:complete len:169 (-),score=27.72 TRINITY_DN678_c0_g1_i13:31-537(-)